MRILKASQKLLDATLRGNEAAVAEGLDLAHTEVASVLIYNDENSLACAIRLACFYCPYHNSRRPAKARRYSPPEPVYSACL